MRIAVWLISGAGESWDVCAEGPCKCRLEMKSLSCCGLGLADLPPAQLVPKDLLKLQVTPALGFHGSRSYTSLIALGLFGRCPNAFCDSLRVPPLTGLLIFPLIKAAEIIIIIIKMTMLARCNSPNGN
jgi:hypothetical protein